MRKYYSVAGSQRTTSTNDKTGRGSNRVERSYLNGCIDRQSQATIPVTRARSRYNGRIGGRQSGGSSRGLSGVSAPGHGKLVSIASSSGIPGLALGCVGSSAVL